MTNPNSLLNDARRCLVHAPDGFSEAAVVLVSNEGNYVVLRTPGLTDDDFTAAAAPDTDDPVRSEPPPGVTISNLHSDVYVATVGEPQVGEEGPTAAAWAHHDAVEQRGYRRGCTTRRDNAPAPIEWIRRGRAHGDPVWQATLGSLTLVVVIPHTEWFWEWSVDCDLEGEEARGTLYVDHDDDAEWNYQDVETAQERCEIVARALLAQRLMNASVPDLDASQTHIQDLRDQAGRPRRRS